VSEAIERDFGLMMAAARVAEHLPALSALRLEESLKQFAAPLREQVGRGVAGWGVCTASFVPVGLGRGCFCCCQVPAA
jgi:hypothetical protein